MNRQDLVKEIALKANLSKKQAEESVKAFMETVTETITKGDKVQLIGFGTFEAVNKPERTAFSPSTRKTVVIPACKAPKFKAGKALKDAINA